MSWIRKNARGVTFLAGIVAMISGLTLGAMSSGIAAAVLFTTPYLAVLTLAAIWGSRTGSGITLIRCAMSGLAFAFGVAIALAGVHTEDGDTLALVGIGFALIILAMQEFGHALDQDWGDPPSTCSSCGNPADAPSWAAMTMLVVLCIAVGVVMPSMAFVIAAYL